MDSIPNVITDNDWHCLEIKMDNTGGVMLMDGVDIKIGNPTIMNTANVNSSNSIDIAAGGLDNNNTAMSVSNVSIYNTKISEDIYSLGRSNPDYSVIPSVVGWWELNELNPVDLISTNNMDSYNMDDTNIYGINNATSVNMDIDNLKNDKNDGSGVNMDESNKICK